MKIKVLIAALALSLFLCACGSSSQQHHDETTSGFKVVGSVEGLSASVSRPPYDVFVEKVDFDPDYSTQAHCPDREHGGTSANTTPTSYAVKLKRVTLLGEESSGTANYNLLSVDNIDDAAEVDFATSTVFSESEDYPPAGTYDGIEIEVYYIGMTMDMAVPAINEDEGKTTFHVAPRILRGYFAEVDNMQPRDVTFLVADDDDVMREFWIDRKTDDPDAFDIVSVSGTHPDQVLDLWADQNFWNDPDDPTKWRDPLTICTRATATCDPEDFGTDFTFEMADGTGEITIPEDPTGVYTITFAFDVTDKFTFYENIVFTTEQGTFRVGYDCGLRFLFPNVTIDIAEGSE